MPTHLIERCTHTGRDSLAIALLKRAGHYVHVATRNTERYNYSVASVSKI